MSYRWDEQNSLLVESHERVIAELTEDYEAKLAEEALKIEALQAEKVRRQGGGTYSQMTQFTESDMCMYGWG